MSLFDHIVDYLHDNIEKKNINVEQQVKKSRRPLKMPKNYDFSVRNVDWKEYEKDYLLRTDAVWERSKLLDVFYTHYKVI
jgi:hypothetical protein